LLIDGKQRPSALHVRAIVFPLGEQAPRFAWLVGSHTKKNNNDVRYAVPAYGICREEEPDGRGSIRINVSFDPNTRRKPQDVVCHPPGLHRGRSRPGWRQPGSASR
jgi:hypothetical protein